MRQRPRTRVIVYTCGVNLCRINGDGSNPVQLTTDGTADDAYSGASLSSGGTKMSFAQGDKLYVSDGSAQNRAGPYPSDGQVVYTKLSPDGSTIAAEEKFYFPDPELGLCLWSAATAPAGQQESCGRVTADPGLSFGWGPAGSGMLTAVYPSQEAGASPDAPSRPEQICLATNAPDYQSCEREVAGQASVGLTEPAISPDGTEIAVVAAPQDSTQPGSAQRFHLRIFNFATGALVRKLTDGASDTEPVWSPRRRPDRVRAGWRAVRHALNQVHPGPRR